MSEPRFFRKYRKPIVWILRIIVGATFIFSGFAKAVDPWGFMYKLEEYLSAWSIEWAPREIIFMGAVAIAMYEFCAGLMLLLGCMRRVSVYCLMAMMCVMLPLTAYIWIVSPVADCGCFGDALVISNGATFAKNIVITLFLVILIPRNMLVKGVIRPLYQWLPLTASILYCLAISVIGYMVQPIVDFRPYKVGQTLLADAADADDSDDMTMVYEKDGVEQSFSIDELPDSTWTFVRREDNYVYDPRQLTIYDEDEDVTEDVISADGYQMLLIVSDPQYQGRARSSMVNRLSEFMKSNDGEMIALVPISGDNLANWKQLVIPDYDVYTVENTVLKEIARGDGALVMLDNGVVAWKRNIYSLPASFPDGISTIEEMNALAVIDDKKTLLNLTLLLLAAIALAAFMDNARNIFRKQSV